MLALLSGSNAPQVQSGLLGIANRVFTLYGGLKRLARRAGSARIAVAEFDALCMLVDHAHVDPRARQSWIGTILSTLDLAVEARLESGELSVPELLALIESGIASSTAARQTLVRRLSRATGIVP